MVMTALLTRLLNILCGLIQLKAKLHLNSNSKQTQKVVFYFSLMMVLQGTEVNEFIQKIILFYW